MTVKKVSKIKIFNGLENENIYNQIGGFDNVNSKICNDIAKLYGCTRRDIMVAVYRHHLALNNYEGEDAVRFLIDSGVSLQLTAYATDLTIGKIRNIIKKDQEVSDSDDLINAYDDDVEVVDDDTAEENHKKSIREKFEDMVRERFVSIPNCSYVRKVGLCSDRHDMPVTDFIFTNPVSQSLMFDYAEQERIVNDWIDTHIVSANGEYIQGMLCYTTGLNCLNASVAKVCMSKGVGLIFMNYDRVTNTYVRQEMIPIKKYGALDYVLKIYTMAGRFINVNIHSVLWDNLFDIKPAETIYAVEICHTTSSSNVLKVVDTYLYRRMSDINKDIYIMCDRFKPSATSQNKLCIVKYTSDGTKCNKEVIALYGVSNVVFS
jgi:hypothetical protein